MTEKQAKFERKDIVVSDGPVPELTDDEKFNSRGNVPAVQSDSPNAVIMMAMQNNYTPELIEKMMGLQAAHEANEARKDHFQAVANFKAKAPPVKKDKYNLFLKCWYTSLGQLLQTYNPVLAEEGLSVSFQPPAQTESTMTVECRLAHSSGHVESVSMTGPIDTAAIGKQSGKASRNPMQDLRSTFTYLRSTTLEAILGVSGTEATEDVDGNTASGEPEYITEAEQKKLTKDLTEIYGTDASMFFEWIGAETVDTVLASDMPKIKKGLNSAKKAKAEAAKAEREPGQEG